MTSPTGVGSDLLTLSPFEDVFCLIFFHEKHRNALFFMPRAAFACMGQIPEASHGTKSAAALGLTMLCTTYEDRRTTGDLCMPTTRHHLVALRCPCGCALCVQARRLRLRTGH